MALAISLVCMLACSATASAESWEPYDRPAQYHVEKDSNVPITMRDGTVLSADVYRPDRPGRYPTIVTQTPYNKSLPIGPNEYLVERGYVQVVVDVRGTGGSQGTWDSFGDSEQRDGYELVEWAAQQPWSDGKVGTYGPSYLAINQLFTAAQHPPHLKAIFPIVPMADSYRDVTMSGGQSNTAFIPFWLGLVTGAGLVPPQYALQGSSPEELTNNLVRGATTLSDHIGGAVDFQAGAVINTMTGGDLAYDGPFYRQRSTIEELDQIDVPAFIVGGLHDIFQRGEPLVYEKLKRRVPTRLLVGPWKHVQASSGDGLAAAGLPSLEQLSLRWFDKYLKGIDSHVERIPRVTYYALGPDRYEIQDDWPNPRLRPERLYLRQGGVLAPGAPTGDEPADHYIQNPSSGICTRSTEQWTAGLADGTPCMSDNRVNEAGELTYTTAPVDRDVQFTGPISADMWVKTTRSDALMSVRVTDVSPSGQSRELSGGWLSASFRAVDPSQSRTVKGTMLQPYHPFTRESVMPVPAGEPVQMNVEVFPTNAIIQKGHRLRVSIGPSDFPHAMPPIPQGMNQLAGAVDVLHDPQHPSSVALPVLGASAARAARGVPRSVSASISPKRDRRAPYRFKLKGGVKRPSGMPKAEGCRGKVAVTVSRGRTAATRRAKLAGNCKYRMKLGSAGTGRLRIKVRFLGNSSLRPRSARSMRARAG